MAFDYDLAATDATIALVSKIRLAIGDTVEGAGPRPDGRNFSNEELTTFYSDEDSHAKRAAAVAFEVLSAEWSAFKGRHKMGPEDELFNQDSAFAERAEKLRARYGYGSSDDAPGQGGFSITLKPAGQATA